MSEPVDALDPAYRPAFHPTSGPRQTFPPPAGPRWAMPPPAAASVAPSRTPLGPRHRQLGRSLTFLLAACAVVSLLRLLLSLYGAWLLDGWQADPASIIPADGENFDSVTSMLTHLWLLVRLATAGATLVWLYQAYGSREADPALLTYQRWWTIGGWFVPVISVWRPYQLLRDLYLATGRPPLPGPPRARGACPKSFRWWWLCFLTGNVLSGVIGRMVTKDSGLAQIEAALALQVVQQALMLVAAVLFIAMIRLISSNLWHRAQLAELSDGGVPAQIPETQIPETQIARCSSESTATATNTRVR